MKRRTFLGSMAASALVQQSRAAASTREYYELRCYRLQSGPQQKLTDQYVGEALIPALNRLAMKPIGAFTLNLGPETPSVYVLIPSTSLESLVNAELRLAQDEEYLKAGATFLNAPAKEPAYARVESSLMIAFEGWPKLQVPPPTTPRNQRVFQLRTYESPSHRDHRLKVEMFHNGEFEFFQKAGFSNVFFGDTLIGARLPNLTYMVSFPSLNELTARWEAFNAVPEWKKLRSSEKFSFEPIVSNITNLILNPTSYSQI